MTRRTGVLLVILALLTVLSSLSACADDTTRRASVPPGTTTPTPSNSTIAQNAITLGGSVVAFDTKFGAGNCCFENGWTYQGPFGQQMWTGVNTGHTIASNVDEGSMQPVIDIENSGPQLSDMRLTLAQAKSLCGGFLPADAKLQHSITESWGSELLYTSTLLANTLPTSAFVYKDGAAAPAGTIFMYYEDSLSGPTNTIGHCGLATDESLFLLQSLSMLSRKYVA